MGRPLRVWEPGHDYHVIPVGNNGCAVTLDDQDRDDYVGRLEKVAVDYELEVIGYCVMGTHVHKLIRAGHGGGISEAMQVLMSGYARSFNEKYGCRGHRFVNHTFAKEIRDEAHLVNALRYIDLNPVASGEVERPEEWKWSSFRAHAGIEAPSRALANASFLRIFGSTPATGRASYLNLISAELERVANAAAMARALGLHDATAETGRLEIARARLLGGLRSEDPLSGGSLMPTGRSSRASPTRVL
jgi:putative transposase